MVGIRLFNGATIALCLSAALGVAAAPAVAAKPAEPAIVDLNAVIVYASRLPLPAYRMADQKEILTGADLGQMTAHNLAEALIYTPGVDVQTSGPFGQASSISMRGASSRQVAVMVDGIPFNTQLSGQANLSRLPIGDAQQVEIIKGGNSAFWGSGLGGW